MTPSIDGRYEDLIKHYEVPLSLMGNFIMFDEILVSTINGGCHCIWSCPRTILGTYRVTKNNPSGNFLTINWIQTQYILSLGELILTIFLCECVWVEMLSLLMFKVQLTLVTGPLVLFIPMAKHENEGTYISMDNTLISEKTFSIPLGFGGYLLTIAEY